VSRHTRKLNSVLAALALAALSAGCGDSRHVASGRPLRLALTEYRLNPQEVSVGAGTLTILVHNYGRLTHDLVVSEHGQSIASTVGIPPGQSAELDLSLAPGRYQMLSSVMSDQTLGQYGTLTVS
jgi:hypothetical protein